MTISSVGDDCGLFQGTRQDRKPQKWPNIPVIYPEP